MNSTTHAIFGASIYEIFSCYLAHLFLPTDSHMSLVQMEKSSFPLFDIKAEPARIKISPGCSNICATAVLYYK